MFAQEVERSGPPWHTRGVLVRRRVMLCGALQVELVSDLAGVANFGAGLPSLPGPARASAIEVEVLADDSVPIIPNDEEHNFTRTSWISGSRAQVVLNEALGEIDHGPSIRASLRVNPRALYPVGMLVRLLATLWLPSVEALMLHASAVQLEGRGIAFVGNSGAGKTTTARRAGREGAQRLADDMIVLHTAGGLSLEPFVFDVAARLPGRFGSRFPLVRAYAIEKGAESTRAMGPVTSPLAAWHSATMSPVLPPELAMKLVDRVAAVASKLTPRRLPVRASGGIVRAIREDLETDGQAV